MDFKLGNLSEIISGAADKMGGVIKPESLLGIIDWNNLDDLFGHDEKKRKIQWVEFFGIFKALLLAVAKKKDYDMVKITAWFAENYGNPVKIFAAFTELLQVNRDEAQSNIDSLQSRLQTESIFLEAAYIASDVYFKAEGKLKGKWHRSKEFPDLKYRDVDDTGLVSQLYSRTVNGKKEYIYATAGTNPVNPRDWQNNFYQICGDSHQYRLALENARELSARLKERGCSLTFVGHSLGGGEATNNALVTHNRAIVFNPAGLSDETKQKNGISGSAQEAERLVDMFVSDNDVLNLLQDFSASFGTLSDVVPSSDGKRHYLKASDMTPLISHSMESVIYVMECLAENKKITYRH